MPIKSPKAVAQKALRTLRADREERLLLIDRYERGKQNLPFTPESADAEYIQLGKRSVTNVMQFVCGTPTQMLAVDSFRRGRTSQERDQNERDVAATSEIQPEWDHWQKSRLDARQTPVVYDALKFGHSFTLTERGKGKHADSPITKGLSPLRTIALYEDAANDEDPYVAVHIASWPNAAEKRKGKARMWDDTNEYEVTFASLDDLKTLGIKLVGPHGASVCPVTRFAATVDLEGRTSGVVEPMMVLQDRINQTVFDLLIVQSFASFKVRTVSGMAPPVKMKAIDFDGNTIHNPASADPEDIADWIAVIDPQTGRPVPDEIRANAKRMFFAEDVETKFGTLDETPLDGFISAIELGFRHMAALSQTPPQHILGEIANLSAEALVAAETALSRKVDMFKAQFGESWERVFRLAAEIGQYEGAEDFAGEVIWRDTGHQSIAQAADALGKMHEQLGVPKRGLWRMFPGVNANQLAEWDEMDAEENPDVALASRTTRAGTAGDRPTFRLNQRGSTAVVTAAVA